jgi:hypothetical protein
MSANLGAWSKALFRLAARHRRREIKGMFILKSIEQIGNAIQRAKAIRPHVRAVKFGRYEVSVKAGSTPCSASAIVG